MPDDKKRLNINLDKNMYDRMLDRIKQTDIKNITEFIKTGINNMLSDGMVKDGSIKYRDLPEVFRILQKLYNIKKFKNPRAKIELYNLYQDIKKVLPNIESNPEKKYHVNRLDISFKELIVFEISCHELNILINNSIIKEGVAKCQIQD